MRRFLTRSVLRLTRPQRLIHLRGLEQSQWQPRNQIDGLRRQKLADLLSLALTRVPLHRGIQLNPADVAGDPFAALAVFPRCDKAGLTAAGGDALVSGIDSNGLRAAATGGSSGTPFRFYLDSTNREVRYALDYRGRGWAGWRIGDKLLKLWGHHADLRRSARWQERVRSALVNRTMTINTFDLNSAGINSILNAIEDYRAPLIIGYARALAFLATEISKTGGRPFPELRGIISTAETLLPEARSDIEVAFSCPVFDRYGSREFGTMAQQCEQRHGFHVSAEHVLLEVLDPEGRPCGPGERGEIVVTDLDNHAMPFLRYRTGDLAAWATDPCPCGRGLPLLAGVEGRVSDLLVALDGKVIACPGPMFFVGAMTSVKQLQILQERRDLVQMTVVPGEGWSEDESKRLQARMRELLGDVTVGVILVDTIPPTASGKYRFSESRVSPYLQ